MRALAVAGLFLVVTMAGAASPEHVRLIVFPTLGNTGPQQRSGASTAVRAAVKSCLPPSRFDVLAGEDLTTILMQMGETAACKDPQCQARQLREMGVGAGLQTEVMNVGGTLYVTARLLDGTTGTETHSATVETNDVSAIRGAVHKVLADAFNVHPGDGDKREHPAGSVDEPHGDIGVFVVERLLNKSVWRQEPASPSSSAAATAAMLRTRGFAAVPSGPLGASSPLDRTGLPGDGQLDQLGKGMRKIVIVQILEEPSFNDATRLTATVRIHDVHEKKQVFRDDVIVVVHCGAGGALLSCHEHVAEHLLTKVVERVAPALLVQDGPPE